MLSWFLGRCTHRQARSRWPSELDLHRSCSRDLGSVRLAAAVAPRSKAGGECCWTELKEPPSLALEFKSFGRKRAPQMNERGWWQDSGRGSASACGCKALRVRRFPSKAHGCQTTTATIWASTTAVTLSVTVAGTISVRSRLSLVQHGGLLITNNVTRREQPSTNRLVELSPPVCGCGRSQPHDDQAGVEVAEV